MERKPQSLRVVRDDLGAETVAHALGTSSRRAAEVTLWGPMSLAHRCARVIAALKAAGDDEALVRFIQPIDQAIHAAAQLAAVTDDMPRREPARAGPTPVAPDSRTHGG